MVNLQVTDAKESTIELRCLMSAQSAGQAFDLRCEVREKMIDFLQTRPPGGAAAPALGSRSFRRFEWRNGENQVGASSGGRQRRATLVRLCCSACCVFFAATAILPRNSSARRLSCLVPSQQR